MTFEIRDSRGRRVNSIQDMFQQIGKEVLSQAKDTLATDFEAFVKRKTDPLRCPVHGQPLSSIKIDIRQEQMSAQFDACCDALGTLAENTVSTALERNEFNYS